MSELFSVPAELLCHVFASLADRLAEVFEFKCKQKNDPSTPDVNDDFVLHDAEDTIFEEFDSPPDSTDPSAWKENLPAFRVSLRRSAWFAFLVTIVVGGLVGLASLLLMYYIISIAYTCEWKPLSDPTYPLNLKRRRIICDSYKSFFLYFWHPALMCMVFKWSFLKDVNLFACALVGASIDLGYRFILAVYDLFHSSWNKYPLNALYLIVILTSSFFIARKICKTNRFRVIVLALKLSSQFIAGSALMYTLWYGLLPWFAHQEGLLKVVALALTFLVCAIEKSAVRQCALRLDGVNHPGTSYVLVSTAYGTVSIVCRLMQAEFKSLLAFIAISIWYGVINLAYGLFDVFRDHCCETMKKTVYSKLLPDSSELAVSSNTNKPREHRLTADLTIQEMLFSSTAMVLSVGIMSIYGLIHQDLSTDMFHEMIRELVVRIVLGIFIEFLSNIISVMLLTRRRNVPVLRVWDYKWKSHLKVYLVAVIMIVTYTVDKFLIIIRAQYVAWGKLSIE